MIGGLLALVCAACSLLAVTSSRAAPRQSLREHVPAVVQRLPALERLAVSRRLDLVFGLPLRNREALDLLLRHLRPGQP